MDMGLATNVGGIQEDVILHKRQKGVEAVGDMDCAAGITAMVETECKRESYKATTSAQL